MFGGQIDVFVDRFKVFSSFSLDSITSMRNRWILKSDYLTDSSQAGKFLMEESYEWHKNGLTEYSAINLKAPRKCQFLRERTGHGAFYGMRSIIYGESIAPPLDTLKHAVKAGDGTILATSPPYTKFLKSGVDFAVVSPARHVLICGSKSS